MKINLVTLSVQSPSFEHGGRLPDEFTSAGAGTSPELTWSGAPEGTVSFAVIVHDPDAPLIDGFTHWVVYGIAGDATGLAAGATDGFIAGVNGTGQPGWVPAAPPPGHGDHFYFFHLYALGTDPGLAPGLDRDQLLAQIDEHVTAQARLVGVFRND